MANSAAKLNMKSPVSKLLSSLSDKNREILERRFGIGQEEPETLESIGKSYKITRERVRQIQEYGIKRVMARGAEVELAPVFAAVQGYIRSKGGVVREDEIFTELSKPQERAHLSFVLRLMPGLVAGKETDDFYTRFALSAKALKDADALLTSVHKSLKEKGAPVSYVFLTQLSPQSLLSLSKRIKQGPFGDWGLGEWASISPRGVRDKAHLIFEREKRPLHFREISQLIDKHFARAASFMERPTHAQTVHNELIKDPRFVLIGRGLYALAEWGYEPGTVKDVLLQVLKDAGEPLYKEDVLRLISERRFVKPNTIFLNLQNRNYFKKLEDGKYYLA